MNDEHPSLLRPSPSTLCLLICLVAAAVLIATQPRHVFWGPDSGNRFIQMQSLLRSGSVAVSHRFPIGPPHFFQVGGRTFSVWGPAFSAVSAPFYARFGGAGLFVLPVLGTLLLIALLPALTRASVPAVGIIVLFATPLFWYTIVYWEETLAAALLVGAFVLARSRPFAAGAIAGAATVLREEGYIAIAAIVLALLITRQPMRRALAFAAGAAIVLSPWWIWNWRAFGTPLGLHAAAYEAHGGAGRLSNLWPFLLEFSSVPIARIAFVVPAIALIVLSPFRLPASLRIVLFALTAAGFAGLTVLLLRSPSPMRETLYTQGLFPAVPFSAAAFLAVPRLWTSHRFAVVTVAAGIALTTLAVNQTDFGATWGPRYYLWLIPIVIVLAVEGLADFARSTIAVAAAVLLLASSFTIQARGIVLLREKLRFSERVLQAVRADPARTVLTDVFWIPEDLAAAFYEKDFGVVGSDREMALAVRAVGDRPFLFIAARQFRMVSNGGFASILPRVTRRVHIAGNDPLLDVMLLDISTPASAAADRPGTSRPPAEAPARAAPAPRLPVR